LTFAPFATNAKFTANAIRQNALALNCPQFQCFSGIIGIAQHDELQNTNNKVAVSPSRPMICSACLYFHALAVSMSQEIISRQTSKHSLQIRTDSRWKTVSTSRARSPQKLQLLLCAFARATSFGKLKKAVTHSSQI
jgi:hypothetical protein